MTPLAESDLDRQAAADLAALRKRRGQPTAESPESRLDQEAAADLAAFRARKQSAPARTPAPGAPPLQANRPATAATQRGEVYGPVQGARPTDTADLKRQVTALIARRNAGSQAASGDLDQEIAGLVKRVRTSEPDWMPAVGKKPLTQQYQTVEEARRLPTTGARTGERRQAPARPVEKPHPVAKVAGDVAKFGASLIVPRMVEALDMPADQFNSGATMEKAFVQDFVRNRFLGQAGRGMERRLGYTAPKVGEGPLRENLQRILDPRILGGEAALGGGYEAGMQGARALSNWSQGKPVASPQQIARDVAIGALGGAAGRAAFGVGGELLKRGTRQLAEGVEAGSRNLLERFKLDPFPTEPLAPNKPVSGSAYREPGALPQFPPSAPTLEVGTPVRARSNPGLGTLRVTGRDAGGQVQVVQESTGRPMTTRADMLEPERPVVAARPEAPDAPVSVRMPGPDPVSPTPTPAEPLPARPNSPGMPDGSPVAPVVARPDLGAPAKPQPSTLPDTPAGRVAGLSNRAMQAEQEAGRIVAPPSGQGAKLGDALAAGRKLVDEDGVDADELLQRLVKSQSPASNAETGALLYRRTTLEKQVNRIRQELDAAIEQGADTTDLRKSYTEAQGKLQRFVDDAQVLKTRASDAFRALQERAEVDTGDFAAVAAEARRVKGRALNEAEERQIADLTARVREAEAKVQAAEAKAREYEAGRALEGEARRSEVPVFRLGVTPGGEVDVPSYRRLTSAEADDLVAFKRALDSEEPGRVSALTDSWGPDRYERVFRTMEDLDSRDLVDDVVRARRDWLDDQKEALNDVMERETAGALRQTGEDGRGLVARAIGGAKDRYGNIGLPDSYTDEQLERIYKALNTPGRQTAFGKYEKLYETNAGKMSLRDLIFDMRMLPRDVVNPRAAEAAAARRAARAAQVPEEFTLSPEKAQRRSAARVKLAREREEIFSEIDSILKGAAALNDVGKVAYDAARFTGAAGRLALNYAREGVISLDEAVERVIADLGKRGITVTREQVVEDIAGQKKTVNVSDASKRIAALKQEARQQQDLLRKLAGEPAPTRSAGPTSPKSQSTLDLQAQLAEKRVRDREAAKLASAAKRAADGEAALQKRVADIERQIREGPDPVTPPQKTARTATQKQLDTLRRELAEVRRLKAELDGTKTPAPAGEPLKVVSEGTLKLREAVKLKREMESEAAKAATQARQAAERLEKAQAEIANLQATMQAQQEGATFSMRPGKKVAAPPEELANLRAQRDLLKREVQAQIQPELTGFAKFNDIVSRPKSFLSSMDLSAAGRQGLLLSLSQPGAAKNAWGDQMSALLSPVNAARVQAEVLGRPNAALYKRAGLYLSTANGGGPGEEAFARRVFGSEILADGANKIQRGIHQLQRPGRASERAYIAYLNRLRADAFDNMVKGLGDNPSPEALKAVAQYVNTATGRGLTDAGALERAAEGAGLFLFSPRFAASRWEYAMGRPAWGGDSSSRRVIAKEYGKTLGAIGAMLLIGKAAGGQVSTDPDSPDYLKLKIGNSRLDLTGALRQPLQLTGRIGKGVAGATTKGAPAPDVAIGRYLRGKLSPTAGAAINLATRKDMVGNPYEPLNAALDLFAPLTPKEIIQGLMDNGFTLDDARGFLNVLGISVQTYEDRERRR